MCVCVLALRTKFWLRHCGQDSSYFPLLHTLPPPLSPDTAPSLSFSRDAIVVPSPMLLTIPLRPCNIIINSRSYFFSPLYF